MHMTKMNRLYMKEWLTLYKVLSFPSVTSRLVKCDDRLVNGLFHTKCVDVHANEKMIIFKLALSE